MPDPKVDLGYVVIMSLAIGAGLVVRRLVAEPLPLNRLQRLAVLLGAVIGGTLGAKLPYVLLDPEGAVTGLAWLRDGRTITWGLAGGYFGVELAKHLSGVRVKTGDSFAVPVATSIAVGRLACFWSGCCFGAPTALPWGVDFGDGVARHPNQIYEALFHAAMAALLFGLGRAGKLERQRIKLYLVSYMAFRVVSETWRPEPTVALGLTFYQLSALGLGALFAALWWWDARAPRLASRELSP